MLKFSLPRSWFCCLESETYATYVILPGNHLSWNNDCSRRMQHKKNISLGCFTKWLTKKSVKTTDSSNLNVCQSNLHEKQLHCFTKWGTQHCNQKFLKFFWLNEKLMVFSVKRIDYQVFRVDVFFHESIATLISLSSASLKIGGRCLQHQEHSHNTHDATNF